MKPYIVSLAAFLSCPVFATAQPQNIEELARAMGGERPPGAIQRPTLKSIVLVSILALIVAAIALVPVFIAWNNRRPDVLTIAILIAVLGPIGWLIGLVLACQRPPIVPTKKEQKSKTPTHDVPNPFDDQQEADPSIIRKT